MNKQHQLILVSLIAFSLTAFTVSSTFSWTIAEDYEVRFKGKSASGTFSGLKGQINFDPENLATAQMKVSVDVKTISTGNKTKDKHARGKKWFGADQYPTIDFQSKSFQKTANGYKVKGQLSLHGVQKEINIPFTFSPKSEGGIFQGEFTINRKDYGINGPFGGLTVGNEFLIELRVPVNTN